MSEIIIVTRAMGQTVSGQVVVFREGFSPRYDLDRTSGVISRRGHSAEGQSIKDKILVIPTAKGGVAIAVAMQHHLPITFVGLGEKMEDLRPFNGADYARALLGEPAAGN